MLVESETYPCWDIVSEWLCRLVIGRTHPHRAVFLTLSNLQKQQAFLQGRIISSDSPIFVLKQGLACLYRRAQLLENIGMCNLIER